MADHLPAANKDRTETPSLGYISLDDIRNFAETRGFNTRLVNRIGRTVGGLADRDGKIPKSAIVLGRYPERYHDDDLFPSDEEKLEVVTSDGEMNLDTLRQLCVAGTIQALSRQPYGEKTDQILKAFIEEKQKELSDTT